MPDIAKLTHSCQLAGRYTWLRRCTEFCSFFCVSDPLHFANYDRSRMLLFVMMLRDHASSDKCVQCPCFDRCPLSTLPRDALDKIEEVKRRLHYNNGEAIFLQGGRTRGFHILCSGRVKLVYRTKAGRRILIAFRMPGEILNWHAWPEYPFAAELSGKSVVASINAKQVELLMRRYSKLRERIDREYADLGPILLKRMANIAYESAEDRLRNCLTYLAKRHGVREGKSVAIDLPLEERDLAEMIGCSRQTISQGIQRLINAGLIQYAHRKIIVTDVGILEGLR